MFALALDAGNIGSSVVKAQSALDKKKSSKKPKARTNKKSSNVSAASSSKASNVSAASSSKAKDKKKSKSSKALNHDKKALERSSVPLLTSASNADEVSVMSDEASSTATTTHLSPSSSRSVQSTKSSSTSKPGGRISNTTISGESFLFQHSMAVDRTWELLKTTVPEYKTQLGEQIVLNMMDLDATARQSMGINSLRSSRFDEISNFLVLVVVDLSVSLTGPSDLEEFEEELRQMGQQCLNQGIRISLLGEAVTRAVKQTLSTLFSAHQQHTFSQKDEESWRIVIDHVAQKMIPSS